MKIERIDPEPHLGQLAELASVEYGDSEIADLDYLRWQYLDNPAGEAVVVVARSDSGQLAGQYVVIPLEFRNGNETIKGSLSLNTLTHPDYRGQGLFTKMANQTYKICEQEGLSITLGFPNKNSYPGFVRKLQFKHIGNASVMFRPLAPLRVVAGLLKIRNAPKYAPSGLRDQAIGNLRDHIGGFQIQELDFRSHADRYDQLITNQRTPEFSVHKHAAFAGWRFQSIPTRSYQAFQARDTNGLQAACVIRRRKVKGMECAFVVDLQVSENAEGSSGGRALLKAVLSHYRRAGVAMAGMMVNRGSRECEVARSLWFREMPTTLLPHNAPIIVRLNDTTVPESVYELPRWSFSFADYDVF